jgi:hypothetical protein
MSVIIHAEPLKYSKTSKAFNGIGSLHKSNKIVRINEQLENEFNKCCAAVGRIEFTSNRSASQRQERRNKR